MDFEDGFEVGKNVSNVLVRVAVLGNEENVRKDEGNHFRSAKFRAESGQCSLQGDSLYTEL